MNFLKAAVEYFNYAVGFANEFNGTGIFEGVQQKRAPGDEKTLTIEPCPVPKELRRGAKRPEWTKRFGGSDTAVVFALLTTLSLAIGRTDRYLQRFRDSEAGL